MSPTRAFASASFGERAKRTVIAALDTTVWTLLPPIDGDLTGLDVDAEGRPWVAAGGRLLRGTATGAWEPVAFASGPVAQVGGLREEVGWVIEQDGGLWLRSGGQEFAPAVLPAPAFSATAKYRVEAVRTAGRDVWVVASYPERPPGWRKTEWRRALLHNAPGREVLRCTDTGDDDEPRVFVAWPPPAREGCETPYVVLIRTSSWAPPDFAYPTLGAALRGRRELADAVFSEVEIGGRRVAGAAVPDLATGQALASLVAAKVGNTRPEIVCATPRQIRPLPFDLRTGKLAR